MGIKIKQYPGKKRGSVLVLLVISIVILAALGGGLLTVTYGVRHRAIAMKNEAVAMLSAEAGYEKAVFWMRRFSLRTLSSLFQRLGRSFIPLLTKSSGHEGPMLSRKGRHLWS